ncbi:CD99 antigen-like protein 2 isoform X2 [Rana temporaria]|uniref:CD99 antigen-like protein 2 isoform X2 n=1 Tax=Rana temporaria TaxID=8407 RepID=UPI001AADC201|nr:CD99 antigen-like protein 2 isoform X2 [Rana temporaria]
MGRFSPSSLCALILLAAVWSAHGQDFSLEDALDDIPTVKPKPKPPKPPQKPSDDFDFDLFDATQPPKVVPKPPPKKPDIPMTTRKPRLSTKRPPKKHDPNDFDLSDALNDKNDRPAGGGGGGGGGFDDSDLDGIFNDGYKPDKGKGGDTRDTDNTDTGTLAETGTIAGIASALAMALIGAVSSYISYQQKKFCFSIQQGLNAEYVKGEHMEGVVSEEPQVKYSSLESQSAVPPSEDPSKV